MLTWIKNILNYVLVFSTVWVVGVNSLSVVRVGVVPSFRGVTAAALANLQSDIALQLFDINIGTPRSTYDRVDKTYKEIVSLKIHVIVSPYESSLAQAAEALSIPYICTTYLEFPGTYSVQIMPETYLSAHAIMDVAQAYGWKKVGIFYDGQSGIQMLEKFMTDHAMTVRAWRFEDSPERKKVRQSLLEMRKVLVETCIVLCSKSNTDLVLDEARNLAMLSTPPYSWLFKDLGSVMSKSFNKYRDIAVNFTVVSMLSFKDNITSYSVDRLQFVLASDALNLIASAAYPALKGVSPNNLNLTNIMFSRQMNRAIHNNAGMTGLTGNLDFNNQGKRDNFSYILTTVTGNDNYLGGHWFSKKFKNESRLRLYPHKHAANRSTPFPLMGRTAKVVMIQERPFTMLKRDYRLKRGNARFEGFAVDLIDAVAKKLGFDYEIYLVHDGKFGTKEENGEWNGLIGELLSGNATMSVASLVITSEREEVVDFTKPFKTRHISVVMRIPKQTTSKFEFLNPLSPQVWICIVCSFVVVSVVLYILERVGQKTNPEDEVPEITVRESFWFIFGSLLQGNTDSTPYTVPGRILTSAWWFFALILISSYTANLAAFLTVKKINTPIKTVTDLTQQTKIKFGTVRDSGVMSFFKTTNIEHFSKMWVQMSEVDLNSMVDTTDEGYNKVKENDFAFFWDSTVNKYHATRDCDLMDIGPAFDPKGYGIGVPPGATYRDKLSMAILELSENGRLHEIETKWWNSKGCPDLSKANSEGASELQIDNVAGVFFILVGGIIVASLVCLGEYFANAMIGASKMHTAVKRSAKYSVTPESYPRTHTQQHSKNGKNGKTEANGLDGHV